MENIRNRIIEVAKIYAVDDESKFRYTAAKFAEKIGMKGVTVTNYINGSRKPSLEFVVKILENLPINAEWLLLGKGEMNKKTTNEVNLNIAEEPKSDYSTFPEDRYKDQLITTLFEQIELLKEKIDNNKKG